MFNYLNFLNMKKTAPSKGENWEGDVDKNEFHYLSSSVSVLTSTVRKKSCFYLFENYTMLEHLFPLTNFNAIWSTFLLSSPHIPGHPSSSLTRERISLIWLTFP